MKKGLSSGGLFLSAFILVVGIIIAAGALFTAVYDVIYKYNFSNTTNLNAAISIGNGSEWGDPNYWWASGGSLRCDETGIMNFGDGTWMVVFSGQEGDHSSDWGLWGTGAICIGFYKGSNLPVTIGTGWAPSSGYVVGGGKTLVKTNFALPQGYYGEKTAIAGAAGAGVPEAWNIHADGTFKGEGLDGTSWGSTPGHWEGQYFVDNLPMKSGTAATQEHGGYRPDNVMTPAGTSGAGTGGAGYNDGGGGSAYYGFGGGGSCTPWCYPLQSSDAQVNPGLRIMTGTGAVWAFRIDPIVQKPEGSVLWSSVVNYGETAQLGVFYDGYSGILGSEKHKPQYVIEQILAREWAWYPAGLNSGMRTGWVYSVSEDGKSWQGVGPDDKLSTSETQASDTLVAECLVMNEKVKNEE